MIITLTIILLYKINLGVSYHYNIALPSPLYSQTQEKAKHRSVILSKEAYIFIVRGGLLIINIVLHTFENISIKANL